MKYIVKSTIIILIIIFIFFIGRISINILGVITNNHKIIRILYILNINEPYVAYYNDGNIYLKEKNYKEAIKKYNQALRRVHSKEKYKIISNKLNYAKSQENSLKEKINYKNINNKKVKRNTDISNNNRQEEIETYENLSRYNYSYNN